MATTLDYAGPAVKPSESRWWWELVGFALLLAVLPMIVPKFTSSPGQVPAARADVGDLHSALDAFKLDSGRYPTAAEGLGALLDEPTGLMNWRGPYTRCTSRDPWGNPYVYIPPSGSSPPKVLSLGPDRISGTGDDIASP